MPSSIKDTPFTSNTPDTVCLNKNLVCHRRWPHDAPRSSVIMQLFSKQITAYRNYMFKLFLGFFHLLCSNMWQSYCFFTEHTKIKEIKMHFIQPRQNYMKWHPFLFQQICFSYQEHLKTCPIRNVVVRFIPLIWHKRSMDT